MFNSLFIFRKVCCCYAELILFDRQIHRKRVAVIGC